MSLLRGGPTHYQPTDPDPKDRRPEHHNDHRVTHPGQQQQQEQPCHRPPPQQHPTPGVAQQPSRAAGSKT